MRSFNRVLAFTAGSGVVAGACAGGVDTTKGHDVAADFSDYNVIKMYAVYTRGAGGSSVEFHPFGDGIRDPHAMEPGSLQLPDLSDESVNRFITIQHRPGQQLGLGLGALPVELLKPPESEKTIQVERPGTYAVQIGEMVLMNEPEQGMAAEGSFHLFEIELGWQTSQGANTDEKQPRQIDYISGPGSLFALGLGGFIARRRRL
jgi:hypothetical protein